MASMVAQRSQSTDALPLSSSPSTSSSLPASRSENDLTVSSTPPNPQSALQPRPTLTVTPPALPAKPMPAYDYRRDPSRRHTMQFGAGVSSSSSTGLQALPPLPPHVLNPNLGGGPMSARRYRERQLQKSIPISPLARSAPITNPSVNKTLPTLPANNQRSLRYVPSPLSSSATVEEDEDATSSESVDGITAVSTPMTTPGSSSAEINATFSYFGLQIGPRRRKSSLVTEAKKRNRMTLPASMGGLTMSLTLPTSLSLSRKPSSSASTSETSPATAAGPINRRSTATADYLSVPSVQRRTSVYSTSSRSSIASSFHTPPQVPPKPPAGSTWHAHKELPSVSADPKENWITSLPAPTFTRSALPGVIMPIPATKKNRDMIASRNSSTSSLNSVRSNTNLMSLSDLHLPQPAYAASRSASTLHRRSGSGGSVASTSSTDLPLPPPIGPYGHHSSPSGSSSSSLVAQSQSSLGSMTSVLTSPAASYKGSLSRSTSTPDIQKLPQAFFDVFSPKRNTVSTTDLPQNPQSNENLSASGILGSKDSFVTSPVSCPTLCGSGSSSGHDSSCSSFSQSHSHSLQHVAIRSTSSHTHPPSSTLHSHELDAIAEDPMSSCSSLGVIGVQVDKRPSIRSQHSTLNKGGAGAAQVGALAPQLKRKATGKKVAEVGKRLRSVWKKMHQLAGGVREIQQQLTNKHKDNSENAHAMQPPLPHPAAAQTLPSRKSSIFRQPRRSASLSRLDLDKPLPSLRSLDNNNSAPSLPLASSPGKSFEGPARSRSVSIHFGFEKPLPSTPGKDGLAVGRMVSVKAPKTPLIRPVRRAVSMYGTV